jgi:hypothetical protein
MFAPRALSCFRFTENIAVMRAKAGRFDGRHP